MKKTSVLLDKEDVKFLKENGFNLSQLTRKAIDEFLSGKLKETKTKPKDPVPIRVWVEPEKLDLVKRAKGNLSAIVRAKVEKLRSALS